MFIFYNMQKTALFEEMAFVVSVVFVVQT